MPLSADPPTVAARPATGPERAWHALTAAEVARALGVDWALGLSTTEAVRRRHEHGPNRPPEPPGLSWWRILGRQFTDVVVLVLLGAAVVAAFVGEPQDSVAIAIILLLNAALGFGQEYRTERALASLRALAAPRAQVRRDGALRIVSAEELVPGDLVTLQTGDVVPADLRLTEAVQLQIDESMLTGESLPVDKHTRPLDPEVAPPARSNLGRSGTLVTRGRGVGLVVATGSATEFGRIGVLLKQTVREPTPLQRRLQQLGRRLAIGAGVICAVVFGAGLLRGEPLLLMFMVALSLAVAAMPEALPAVVTLLLSRGAHLLARRQALVRRLTAVETLGSVTWICADKTGTLTQNRMQVRAAYLDGEMAEWPPPFAGREELGPRFLQALALCNDATLDGGGTGDTTELALLRAAASLGVTQSALEAAHPRLGELPFTPMRGRMTTLHLDSDRVIGLTKGSPEQLLPRCDRVLTGSGPHPLRREPVEAAAHVMADRGMRVLALAYRDWPAPPSTHASPGAIESRLTLLGLVGIADPPRPEAAQAIALCRSAGITPVMITGDHPGTARAIAREIGLLDREGALATGNEVASWSGAELQEAASRVRVYARVVPEQKLAIVTALQRRGEIVAMTGDGVNDAPALKRADIGIAMGLAGTEVAREAADLVLLDDNFATIVNAVREGRRVYDNIRKFLRYVLTGNAGEIWTLFLAPFFGLPLPLLPVQILWVNLVTDGLPGLAFVAEPEEPGVMRRPPRPPDESVFAGGIWQHVLWVGLLIGGVTLATMAWSHGSGNDHWRTATFTTLALAQLAQALAIRSEVEPAWRSLGANPALLASIALTVGLQAAIVYHPVLQKVFKTSPLDAHEWGVCLLGAGLVFVAVEVEKWVLRRRRAVAPQGISSTAAP